MPAVPVAVKTTASNLSNKVSAYGKKQANWFHDYKPLMVWFIVPLFAFLLLTPGLAYTAPGEEQQTNYWMMAFRAVLFLAVMFAFSGMLAKACRKVVAGEAARGEAH